MGGGHSACVERAHQEKNMGLGISNIIIGSILLLVALWQRTHESAPSVVTAFIVAGAGAVWVGIYQLWRHRYVYNSRLGDDF
jgi:hypothetical membrane protein